jgi:hypothetical protein
MHHPARLRGHHQAPGEAAASILRLRGAKALGHSASELGAVHHRPGWGAAVAGCCVQQKMDTVSVRPVACVLSVLRRGHVKTKGVCGGGGGGGSLAAAMQETHMVLGGGLQITCTGWGPSLHTPRAPGPLASPTAGVRSAIKR